MKTFYEKELTHINNNMEQTYLDIGLMGRYTTGGHPREEVPCPGSKSKYPEYCKTMVVQDANGVVKELVFPKALDLDRPKRARTTFSPEQLYQLEREFQKNQYLVGKERTELSKKLQLSETQVKVWFQNRRTKYKRDRGREAEVSDSKAESLAACNIMRILQQRPPTYPSPLLHPYTYPF